VRILQITSARIFGGGERHFVDLCRELTDRGHEVFVALRPTNEWQDRLHFIPAERFMHVSVRNSFGTFSARRIARFIEENEIDVVHAHAARDYLTASISCRKARRARLVITRHLTLPLKPFHRLALRNVSAAIGVSPAVGEQLERTFSRSRVRVISNGIPIADLSADERRRLGSEFRDYHGIPVDAPLIVSVGELKVLKGQRDLVLAANEVLKRHPQCRFVLAGRDNTVDHRFRRELRRLVRVLGHDDRFLWLDWVEDLAPLFAAADIFVSPSHIESFGLAMLEAMAAGTPVIATDTDGARELVRDAEARVPIKDPVALAAALDRFIADPAGRRALAEGQHRNAAELYSLGRMIDGVEDVYRSIIES
jgi:glycosyltransferase involved in cell wall biosynthesis